MKSCVSPLTVFKPIADARAKSKIRAALHVTCSCSTVVSQNQIIKTTSQKTADENLLPVLALRFRLPV